LKLADLQHHLLHQFASEADLVRAIDEISIAFTKDRANIHKYLNDPRLVSAYTVFYLATNVPKLQAVMEWLTPAFREELLQCELIDVGAGPGTFSIAWRELGGKTSVMLETSKLMREQAAKLFEGMYQEKASFKVGSKTVPRLVLFGHSLNEMGVKAGLDYIREANADYVWLIEPGTKDVFKMALEFRREMLRLNWKINYPCLGMSACPMEKTDDWCHQYVDVRHDAEIERLTQLAHKDRRRLPLTVMMFQRAAMYERSPNLARIVRVKEETKFSHEWQVCRPESEELILEDFQLQKKSYPKEWKKSVEALLSGSLIQYETEKEIQQSRRIRLIKDTSKE
jgi:ribosomal protein RSM22 (predicted rRNA methylase)